MDELISLAKSLEINVLLNPESWANEESEDETSSCDSETSTDNEEEHQVISENVEEDSVISENMEDMEEHSVMSDKETKQVAQQKRRRCNWL